MSDAGPVVPQTVALWVCVTAIGVAGFALGILPLDRARVQAVARAAGARSMVDAASAAMPADGPPVSTAGEERPAVAGSEGSATGMMLRAIFSASAQRGMRVVSVVPDETEAVRAHAARDYTITVEGRFRDLLAFLKAISEGETLVDVRSADVHVANASAAYGVSPLLDSTVHITLYGAGGAR